MCSAEQSELRDAHDSFPSEHAALAFAGLGYLSLCLGSRLARVHTPCAGELWKHAVALAPALVAIGIGISRLIDNKHHGSDVLVGALLGQAAALALYRLRFPTGPAWTMDPLRK